MPGKGANHYSSWMWWQPGQKKRPVMAEVACEYSDKVIFTSDNPRGEDPLQILKDMEAGVNIASRKNI